MNERHIYIKESKLFNSFFVFYSNLKCTKEKCTMYKNATSREVSCVLLLEECKK